MNAEDEKPAAKKTAPKKPEAKKPAARKPAAKAAKPKAAKQDVEVAEQEQAVVTEEPAAEPKPATAKAKPPARRAVVRARALCAYAGPQGADGAGTWGSPFRRHATSRSRLVRRRVVGASCWSPRWPTPRTTTNCSRTI